MTPREVLSTYDSLIQYEAITSAEEPNIYELLTAHID
jgi:hypothetical protein